MIIQIRGCVFQTGNLTTRMADFVTVAAATRKEMAAALGEERADELLADGLQLAKEMKQHDES